MAVPGWPLPTFSTASAARIRAVSTALESISSQISDNGLSPYQCANLNTAELHCPVYFALENSQKIELLASNWCL
jgi:hypothetical protein